jgi:hypothetical protein
MRAQPVLPAHMANHASSLQTVKAVKAVIFYLH